MITVYYRTDDGIACRELETGEAFPARMLWVDLLHPDETERALVAALLGLNLPTRSQMAEIEVSSRLRADGHAAYLTTDVLVGSETPDPEIGDLTVVVAPGCLLTLRYSEPRALAMFAYRIQNQAQLFATQEDGLLAMLDAIVDRTADVLEAIGRRVDDLSLQIFRRGPEEQTIDRRSAKPGRKRKEKQLQEILQGIGRAGDMNHKVRDSVNGMIRLVTFLGPILTHRLNNEQMKKFKALDRDLRSLSEHAQSSAHETSFLLDATLGQINIEQNAIIKIFSVVSVVFMPPTLFASIWGMNFHAIPELSWSWGYYMALGVMVASAVLPLAYFRRRGWL